MRYGVFGVSTCPIGCDTPPPFLSVPPLESMRSGGARHPPQKGNLSGTCAIPYENKENACETPLCDTISTGYCAIWGVSRTGPLSEYFGSSRYLSYGVLLGKDYGLFLLLKKRQKFWQQDLQRIHRPGTSSKQGWPKHDPQPSSSKRKTVASFTRKKNHLK